MIWVLFCQLAQPWVDTETLSALSVFNVFKNYIRKQFAFIAAFI